MELNRDIEGFDWKAAHGLAICAQMSYEPEDRVRRFIESAWTVDGLEFVDEGETQLFILRQNGVTIMAIRGSQSVADWIRNGNARGRDTNFGRVHSGFLQSFNEVKDRIFQVAEETPIGSLFFSGHSLGGAISSICAAALHQEGLSNRIHSLYTFGQPRTGRNGFTDNVMAACNGQVYRFVNNNDIVTRIPPLFSHHGHRIRFMSSGDLRTDLDILPQIFNEIDLSDGLHESAGTNELPALSEDEFNALKVQLDSIETLSTARIEGLNEDDLLSESDDVLMEEGNLSIFGDHFMVNYVSAIQRFVQLEEEGLNERPLSTNEGAFRSSNVSPGVTEVRHAQISTIKTETYGEYAELEEMSDYAELAPEGTDRILYGLVNLVDSRAVITLPDDIALHSRIGSILSVSGTEAALKRLLEMTEVDALELSRPAGTEELTESRTFMRTSVTPPEDTERGDKALIAVIDSGIDILHNAFNDADGNSRIIGVWDLRAPKTRGQHLRPFWEVTSLKITVAFTQRLILRHFEQTLR